MLRITTEWVTQQGSPYYTTHHFSGTLETDRLPAMLAVQDLWSDMAAELFNGMSGTILGDVPNVDPATGQILQMFSGNPIAIQPTGTGEVLPWATQGLIRWRTGVFINGREVRGRTFVPGFREVSSTLGKPAASFLAGMNTLITNWIASQPAGNRLVIWKRPSEEGVGTATVVQSGSLWDQWAQLRSRRD